MMLMSPVNRLQMDLEKHLEKAVQSIIRYKQQLRKVLGEVNRRNKKDLKDARAKERQRMREIEHLKLHYQMRKDTEAESKELGQIKKEMHELVITSGFLRCIHHRFCYVMY